MGECYAPSWQLCSKDHRLQSQKGMENPLSDSAIHVNIVGRQCVHTYFEQGVLTFFLNFAYSPRVQGQSHLCSGRANLLTSSLHIGWLAVVCGDKDGRALQLV